MSAAPRPLIVSDCDEVLLHMVAHFKDWLEESQGVDFALEGNNFADAMRWQDTGEAVGEEEIWRLLGRFFDTEMPRQKAIPGAIDALKSLAEIADVVILTNLVDKRREMRAQQLAEHGLDVRVFTNQGPKGPALAAIVAEYQPTHTIFIDDLAQHHRSAKETVEGITTLHLCGEPMLAPHIDCAHVAGDADARIDTWDEALPWIRSQLERQGALLGGDGL